MKYLDVIAAILLVIGGLNWGLVGFFDFNLVTAIFGQTILTKIVYGLVTISAIYQIFSWKGIQNRWGSCDK